MAAEGDVIITFMFTGIDGEVIPQNATHLIIHESVTVIPASLFFQHPRIVDVYCHAGVKIIESSAFCRCPRLRRVIMRGVEVIQTQAFIGCTLLAYVECDKLERIEWQAFNCCKSLSSINLPSAKLVNGLAFACCEALTEVKFGKKLEMIREEAFVDCRSLQRITIPLKNGLFSDDDIFQGCRSLRHVDLLEKQVLKDTIDSLHYEGWRNGINMRLASIEQHLPLARDGDGDQDWNGSWDVGEKTHAIRVWVRIVLQKMIQFKSLHSHLLNEGAITLKLVLPNDIVMNNILPFLQLPVYTFDGEEEM